MDINEWADGVEHAVRNIYGTDPIIPLHRPFLTEFDMAEAARRMADDPVDTKIITGFEEELADACGVPYAVATSSGTAALHLALMVAGAGPEKSVSMSPRSFIAAHNAAVYCGAPVRFSDEPTADIHISSHIIGMTDPWLHELARGQRPYPKDLFLIEDAAEALGSRLYGRPLGGWGDVGILSFNNNKLVTTLGGGALVTANKAIADAARHMGSTRRVTPVGWDYDGVGFNYRMGTINAALGLLQLRRLPGILAHKRDTFRLYVTGLKGALLFPAPDERPNHWLVAMHALEVDKSVMELQRRGIMARPAFKPLPDVAPCKDWPTDRAALQRARDYANGVLMLPSGWPGDA